MKHASLRFGVVVSVASAALGIGCGSNEASRTADGPDASALGADASAISAVAATNAVGPGVGVIQRPVHVAMPRPQAGAFVRREVGDPRPEHPSIAATRVLAATDKPTADRLVESKAALTLTQEGFVSEAWRAGASNQTSHLGAVLPHAANDVLRVSPGHVEAWAMSLAPRGHAAVIGSLDGGRVLYEEALPHTDIIATAGDHWVEELYLLKDAQAPTELHWHLQLGSALTRKPTPTTMGQIEFVDRHGETALRLEKPYAIDAKGTRLDAAMKIEGDELTISIDPKGLTYPIVIDPLIDVPSWSQIYTASGAYMSSDGMSAAYVPSKGKVLMAGGGLFASSTYLTDVYGFDGTTWAGVGAGTAIAGRSGAAVAQDTQGGAFVFGGNTGFQTWGTITPSYELYYLTTSGAWWTICAPGGACNALVTSGNNFWDPAGTVATHVSADMNMAVNAMTNISAAYLGSYGSVIFGTDRNTYFFNNTLGGDWLRLVPMTDSDVRYSTPASRNGYMLSGDVGTGNAILFSGWDGTNVFSDAWRLTPGATGTYNDAHWKQLCG
ncbi:MAG: hypothetical protein ACHREM_15255, partial [Polyangiales bacterium]